MSTPDLTALDLHEMLLRLAGWVPDDVLVEARGFLAHGLHGEVAHMVAFAGTRCALPLTADDLGILTDLLEIDGADLHELDTVELIDPGSPLPWRFAPLPPFGGAHGGAALAGARLGEDLAAALTDEPAACRLWQAWRRPVHDTPDPPCPVYLVEVDDARVQPALTGRLQEMLAVAGERVPCVEVVRAGSEVPAYQRMVCARGRELWAAATPAIRVARIFDTADSAAWPAFAPEHPLIVDRAARERVLAYLNAGAELVLTMSTCEDVVDPVRGAVVPMSLRTDGTWVWTDTITYYLREYHLAPDPRLLAHIRLSGGLPAAVGAASLLRVMDAMTDPARAESIWSTDGV
ncbi:hypothetical protein [Amycolatopsis minnesotensis]|uniref:Uncharacterized protein n=1 Tax=Amycolatopsis minnesotensis TaxID=337894 RepID=A0ABP5DKW6_9PSEU